MHKGQLPVCVLIFGLMSAPTLVEGQDVFRLAGLLPGDESELADRAETNKVLLAANSNICDAYAKHAIHLQQTNLKMGCNLTGERWHTSYNRHFQWCMRTPDSTRKAYVDAAAAALKKCPGRKGAGNNAAKTNICRDYADHAIHLQRTNQKMGCNLTGERWHLNYDRHFQWCMRTPDSTRKAYVDAAADALRKCPGRNSGGKVTQDNPKTFRPPMINGFVVDNCKWYGVNCGGGGAQLFCEEMGYRKASNWKLHGPVDTYIIGSKRSCKGCTGYSFITCIR